MTKSHDCIASALNNTAKVTRAIQAEIHSALIKHKQAGNAICEWRDGKVLWISPEDIPDRTKE